MSSLIPYDSLFSAIIPSSLQTYVYTGKRQKWLNQPLCRVSEGEAKAVTGGGGKGAAAPPRDFEAKNVPNLKKMFPI